MVLVSLQTENLGLMFKTTIHRTLFVAVVALTLAVMPAVAATDDYKQTPEYLALRDSVHHAFNDGDSARFFSGIVRLEDYLLRQNDLHAYYTQRCNEIVFQLNRERVIEAYKLATRLSKELTERKLDKEMYMAVNMMGHIYRYSGNKESAKRCFWDVIRRMEKAGYTESLPPIYMNLVNILMDEDPQEAMRLINKAAEISRETSPERAFDIETRRTLAYYLMGDTQRFIDGYQAYREGVAQGLSSVHGRKLEVYYLASQGRTDEAARLAAESADDPYETQADIYSRAGRWQEAFEALKKGAAETDSINSVILSNSMQGIQEDLHNYEKERRQARRMLLALTAIACLLLMLVVALVYIVYSRRRNQRQLQRAYQHALESDNMKTAFMQMVSHEVRTPLNVISGFAQVIADPDYDVTPDERRHIAATMTHNTYRITTMINEMLEMSVQETSSVGGKQTIRVNDTLRQLLADYRRLLTGSEAPIEFASTLSDEFTFEVYDKPLGRILQPLLGNALKYAPQGTPVIVRAAADAQHLIISVEDRGPGVPAHEAEHIFERFVKLDSFKEGLGLGLTYSRTLVRRIGGDVRLDTSYAGPGARFEVVLS